jgi:HlyD family secretion protein
MAVLAVGVVVGTVLGIRRATRPAEVAYRTANLDKGSIVARVTATGTLSAHVTVQVGAQVSGRLLEILVDFNSSVKKGQIIARLDPALFQAALASAHANTVQGLGSVAKSRATLEKDKKLLERAKQLNAEGLISKQDFDNAAAAVDVDNADLEAQRGQLEQNRAMEHQAEINLAYCTIISPIDGTVISRNVDVGQTVAASLSAPTLFTIAEDLHKMQVDTNVTEGDVGKLRDGMRATFVVDAYANDRFSGVIQQIRNAATTVQNVVTYDAVIEVENSELKLRPGMTANATIVYDRREDTLRVPNAALRFRPPAALADASASALAAISASAPDASPPPRDHGANQPAAASSAAPAGSASAAPAGSASAKPRKQRPPTDNTNKVLWVMRGPKPVPVSVKVGLTDGSFTEIVSGDVQEGDSVVLEVMSGDDGASAKPPAGGGNGPPRMRL